MDRRDAELLARELEGLADRLLARLRAFEDGLALPPAIHDRLPDGRDTADVAAEAGLPEAQPIKST